MRDGPCTETRPRRRGHHKRGTSEEPSDCRSHACAIIARVMGTKTESLVSLYLSLSLSHSLFEDLRISGHPGHWSTPATPSSVHAIAGITRQASRSIPLLHDRLSTFYISVEVADMAKLHQRQLLDAAQITQRVWLALQGASVSGATAFLSPSQAGRAPWNAQIPPQGIEIHLEEALQPVGETVEGFTHLQPKPELKLESRATKASSRTAEACFYAIAAGRSQPCCRKVLALHETNDTWKQL